MRLILGRDKTSDLLIDTHCTEIQDKFSLYAINGAWYGEYNNGIVSVLGYDGKVQCTMNNMKILCDDQKLLRGNDYSKIMNKFDKIQQLGNQQ